MTNVAVLEQVPDAEAGVRGLGSGLDVDGAALEWGGTDAFDARRAPRQWPAGLG